MVGVAEGGLQGGDTPQIIQNFIDQTGVTFPVGFDTTSSYNLYPRLDAISPFPLDVVIGRDGNVAYVSREYDAAALLSAVQQAL